MQVNIQRLDLDAEAAVKIAPGRFLPHNVLGWALLANRQFDRAIEEMAEAVRLSPDTAATHYSLAQAYEAAGNHAAAQREQARFERLTQPPQPAKAIPQ